MRRGCWVVEVYVAAPVFRWMADMYSDDEAEVDQRMRDLRDAGHAVSQRRQPFGVGLTPLGSTTTREQARVDSPAATAA